MRVGRLPSRLYTACNPAVVTGFPPLSSGSLCFMHPVLHPQLLLSAFIIQQPAFFCLLLFTFCLITFAL
jgi:hypothetical protein